MIVLKAIGAFFVKIWRWIKETAWVQPLLIVGAIFAIIFSIPYITDWVSSWGYASTGAFFNSAKKSLDGEESADFTVADGYILTEADTITENIYTNTKLAYANDYAKIDSTAYGEKFFFIYTSSDCDGCDKAEDGFKYLSEQWGSKYLASDNREFKFYTIFTDEDSTNDDDYSETLNDTTAFHRYLGRYLDFFNITSTKLQEAPYKDNASPSDDSYKNYEGPDSANFSTPTILLVDYSKDAVEAGRGGVCEVLFGVSGDTDAERAKNLINMWNHLDSDTQNPFSAVYKS